MGTPCAYNLVQLNLQESLVEFESTYQYVNKCT